MSMMCGCHVQIFTGAGTGTADIDIELPELTGHTHTHGITFAPAHISSIARVLASC